MQTDKLFNAAKATADWMVTNMVTQRTDANKGRTISSYNEATGEKYLTTSWVTATSLMGLLAMYKRTGDQKYLDAAELAGHYIMSLQVMDQRQEKYYGVIRECTPQSIEFCPRDSITAAWGLVWLFEATKNEEYLDRAVRYAEWHLKYGMCEGWPKWAIFMDEERTRYFARGSFQSGSGLFYHDLFLQCGDTRYIEFGMKPIAENYKKYYFNEDGSIIQERRIFTNEISDRGGCDVEGHIHNYNDDFGNQMLQAAADLFKDESYRDTARKFALWLARHRDPRGGWYKGSREVSSAVPMAAMYFHELGNYYKDQELLTARDSTLQYLLDMQILDTDNPCLHGAFASDTDDGKECNVRRCTNIRTTSYALIALLKLENQIRNFWLGGCANDGFTDRLDTLMVNPYKFKW